MLKPSAATAAAVAAGTGASPATFADGAIMLPLDMPEGAERVFWDIPFSAKMPGDSAVLTIVHSTREPPPHLRAYAIHLKSGKGWYAWPEAIQPQTNGTARLPLDSFKREGEPGPVAEATALRISAWRDATYKGAAKGGASLAISGITAGSAPIRIVRATASSAPGEEGFAAKMAERSLAVFQRAGYEAAFIDDSFSDISSAKLLVIPYSPKLGAASAEKLRKFAKGGGRIVVHYSSCAPLAELFGIAPPAWSRGSAKDGYAAMKPSKGSDAAETLAAFPHKTSSVFAPIPKQGSQARIRAVWVGADGKATRDPACVVSQYGAWFAHVPSLPTPAAAAFMREIVGEIAPAIPKPAKGASAAIPKIAPAARPKREIRGVWFSTPTAFHPGGWNSLFAELAKSGFCNTAFVHLQAAGTACYPSDGKLPERLPAGGGVRVEDIAAAGRKNGISVHAWVECWNASAAAPEELKKFRATGRLMRNAAGKQLDWLCPDNSANRAALQSAILDLAARGVNIQLDYIRYPLSEGCYCDTTRKAFEKAIGKKVASWPADVVKGGALHDRFLAFRAQSLTSWVSGLSAALKKRHPGTVLSAAVFSNPASGTTIGQDWPAWVRGGLVEFVSPMIYTENTASFSSYLARCVGALDDPAATLVPGIGVTADESQLDAAATAAQINACRALKLRGFAFFAYDASLGAILKELRRK